MKNNKKNLIIVSIDNLRSDCVGAKKPLEKSDKYQLKNRIETETLDKLLQSGVFFSNCISTAPYTTNAHASFLTGFWPFNHGVIDFFGSRLEKPTIFNILKSHGYSTLWQTDFSFLLGSKLGFTKRIDKVVAGREEESFAWLKENHDKNFACFFHFDNVHEPYGYSSMDDSGSDYFKRVLELLKKNKIEPDEKAYPANHYLLSEEVSENDLILKQNYRKLIKYLYEREEYSEIMDLYIEGLNYFDKNRFSKFISNLEENNLLDNTVLIIFGDHGEAWDSDNQGHSRGNGKKGLIDEILKVPMIIWEKNKKGNMQIDKQVRSIDLVPTCLSLLDVFEKGFDGVDLSDYVNIGENLPAYSQLWETDSGLVTIFMNKAKELKSLPKADFSSRLTASAIRQNGYTLMDYYKTGSEQGESLMQKDSKDLDNLFQYSDVLDVFRRRLDDYNVKAKDKISEERLKINNDDREDIARQLKSIGYNV